MSQTPLTQLPGNLPVPKDDGACHHLPGSQLPDVPMVATSGGHLNLRHRPGLIVLYAYPLTGAARNAASGGLGRDCRGAGLHAGSVFFS